MEKIICNPLNLEYRYQHKTSPFGDNLLFREAADPTMLLFKGKYLLFASMSGGFWYSDDLCDWAFKETPELPIYDYAPDVREINGEVVFSASRRGQPCTLFKSADPLAQPFQPVSTIFDFWDPDIFQDDDGRVYFYWGCTNTEPIWGLELDPKTLQPIGEKQALFGENEAEHAWERNGENNRLSEPKTDMERKIREHLGTKPFIEGAYMTKHNGRYYLQYAAPGTQYNVYADGVYVADAPLGPFTYQPHNAFSAKPGGFITGAGHGSTFQDKAGNWWHVSTIRISVHENFERRIGLFPCDFDADGVLWCNQNFADYPYALPEGSRADMGRTAPDWLLLSYGKPATASSSRPEHGPQLGVNEDVRSWWAAQTPGADEWFQVDLGEGCRVHAVQLNFADHDLQKPELAPEQYHKESMGGRYIEVTPRRTAYLLEGSADGQSWQTLRDRHTGGGDYAHDWTVLDSPLPLRYLRVRNMVLPYGGVPAISGLRVFGRGGGSAPGAVAGLRGSHTVDGTIRLDWQAVPGADGYNVRYGLQPDKLYSSWQLYGATGLDLSMVNANTVYYVAVDSFNGNGVTAGEVVKIG